MCVPIVLASNKNNDMEIILNIHTENIKHSLNISYQTGISDMTLWLIS